MKDLSGLRFGSLVVTKTYERIKQSHGIKIKWLCKCDCGAEMFVFSDALSRRKVQYCDCCRPSGVRNERLYHIYHGMKQRCYNEASPNYIKYGAKGIKVCDEWLSSYDAFKSWALSSGYREDLTIDRERSEGDYSPDNCRWVTLEDNARFANLGRHKNKTKLVGAYAIDQFGNQYQIDNISKFATEHGLNRSNVSAALHGRISCRQGGWTFISNKSKP